MTIVLFSDMGPQSTPPPKPVSSGTLPLGDSPSQEIPVFLGEQVQVTTTLTGFVGGRGDAS